MEKLENGKMLEVDLRSLPTETGVLKSVCACWNAWAERQFRVFLRITA